MFTEALGWRHEEEFLFVAFQNRVAHAMEGTTMHTGSDIAVGGQRTLNHTDLDVLFTRNHDLRWVIIDEFPMIADDILGAFASHLTDAARESRYLWKADKTKRFMGGYNLMMQNRACPFPTFCSSSGQASGVAR